MPEAVPDSAARAAADAMAYLKGDGRYSDRSIHPFPLMLLLDLKIPGGSSFELIGWVRAEPLLNCVNKEFLKAG